MQAQKIFGIAAIILSTGFLLRSLEPAYAWNTSSISKGSNPVFSYGTYVGSSSNSITIPHQSGQELMVSDIFLHADNGYNLQVSIQTSSGTVLGVYRSYGLSMIVETQLKSPLRVPAGEDLVLVPSGRGVYTISGYHSQP